MTKQNTVTTETAAVVAYDVKKGYVDLKTKSALIRHMATLPEFQKTDGKPDAGKINKAINAAEIKMIYQHVRNVLTKPLKKAA
jgi:hypothetical protein